MKHRISIMLLSALALVSPRVFAVTTTVLPGESIQAAVDAATAGDQLIIKGGTYGGSITIDKNLDFRREAGATVHITGSVTLSGITGTFAFAHFKVGTANDNDLTVTNCDDVFLEDVNATIGGGLVVTNSKVYAYDCSFGTDSTFTDSNWTLQECVIAGNVTSNSSDAKVLRSNVTGNLTHNQTSASNCTVFQSTIGERLHSKAGRSWINYNTIRWVKVEGNATIVGNDIDGRDGDTKGVHISGADSAVLVANNKIHHHGGSHGNGYGGVDVGVGVWIAQPASSSTKVLNNNIWDCRLSGSTYRNNHQSGMGIYVQSTGGTVIQGNIIWDCYNSTNHTNNNSNASVRAPSENVLMTHNNLRTRAVAGGVSGPDNLDLDPQFLDANQTLAAGSPCIDAGPPEVEFKDHNATRNDMGVYGGHLYDPDGKTASRPVVLSGKLAPMRIQKGVTGTVIIRSRAAVSTPKQ